MIRGFIIWTLYQILLG